MALTWQLKFDDGVTGPAKQAGKATRSLGDDFDALKKQAAGAEAATQKFFKDSQGRIRDAKGKFVGSGGGDSDPFSMGNPFGGGQPGPTKRKGRMNAGSQFNFAGHGASVKVMQEISKAFGPGAVARIGQAANAYERFGPALGAVARFGAQAAMALGAVAMAAGAGLLAATKYIRDAQGFRESTSIALETILGSRREAQKALGMAQRIAFDTGQDLTETMRGMNVLLVQGFDVKFVDSLMRAMADLRVLNPQANLEGITRAISQIKTTGRLQGDELMQLAEAGVNVDKVYTQIAKSMGIVDKAGETANMQVRKLQEAGKVSSDVAIKAIMDSIKAQTGKEFGTIASGKADKTLEGTAARIGVVRDGLLQTMKIDWSPLNAAAQELLKALQSPAGRESADAIGKGLGDIMAALLDVKAGDIEGMLRSAAKGAKSFADGTVGLIEFAKAMSSIYDGASSLVGPIGTVASAIPGLGASFETAGGLIKAAFLGPILGLVNAMSEVGEGTKAAASALGGNIIDGIVQGIQAKAGEVAAAVKGAAKAAIDGAADVLGIASPSKVFRGFGQNLMQSQAMGVRETSGKLTGAVQSASSRAAEAGQTLARAVTNNTNNSTQVSIGTINAGAGAPNAGGLGQAVTDAFRSMFLSHA